jgi:hypothetical protein
MISNWKRATEHALTELLDAERAAHPLCHARVSAGSPEPARDLRYCNLPKGHTGPHAFERKTP